MYKYCKILKNNDRDYASMHVTKGRITGAHPDRPKCFSIINDRGVNWWVGNIYPFDRTDGLQFVEFYTIKYNQILGRSIE